MASFSSSSRPSSPPTKSQPLHNFELPAELKWSKDGKPSGAYKRGRSMNSPPPRPKFAASASPRRRSPLRDSIATPRPRLHDPPRHRFPSMPRETAATPRFQRGFRDSESSLPQSRFQSANKDFTAPPSRLHLYPFRQSETPPRPDYPVVRDQLGKGLPFREETKRSAIGGEFGRLPLLREESQKHYRRRDSSPEANDQKRGKAPVIAYSRNPLRKTGFSAPLKLDRSSINEDNEIGKKSKSAKADAYLRNTSKKPAISSSPTKLTSLSNSKDSKHYKEDTSKKSGFVSDSKASKLGKRSMEEDDDASPTNPKKSAINSSSKPRYSCSLTPDKVKKSKEEEINAAGNQKSNLIIKIGGKKNKQEEEETPKKSPMKTKNDDESRDSTEKKKEGKIDEGWDEEIRVWNLRPRKVKRKQEKTNAGREKGVSTAGGGGGGGGGQKKEKGEEEKKKLSIEISLTKQEIEEDIFALTGAKPSRRPKKWPKNVQKQLDSVFPGSTLVSITPERYKVSENSLKG